MSTQEYKATMKALKSVRQRVRANPAEARKFLMLAGILDAKGNIRRPYR